MKEKRRRMMWTVMYKDERGRRRDVGVKFAERDDAAGVAQRLWDAGYEHPEVVPLAWEEMVEGETPPRMVGQKWWKRITLRGVLRAVVEYVLRKRR